MLLEKFESLILKRNISLLHVPGSNLHVNMILYYLYGTFLVIGGGGGVADFIITTIIININVFGKTETGICVNIIQIPFLPQHYWYIICNCLVYK